MKSYYILARRRSEIYKSVDFKEDKNPDDKEL